MRTSFDAIGSAHPHRAPCSGRRCRANLEDTRDLETLKRRAADEARDKQRPVQSASCVLTREAKSAAPQRPHDYQAADVAIRPAATQRNVSGRVVRPTGAGKPHREQHRGGEPDLLGQLPPRRRLWRLPVPDTATRQMPPDPIRAPHEQKSGAGIDGHCDTLMPWTRQSPPDTGDREPKAESCPPGGVEK